jgi:undecaprenyl pyrophosphate phosphatase UppP
MMDFRFLRTALLPVILGLFLYRYVKFISDTLLYVVLLLFLNGVILYVPQYMPTGNRDSRTLSRVEGLLMGLGGATGILPGISGVGTATAVASICGVDRNYGLTMALMMNMVFSAGMAVISFLSLLSNGLVETLSFMMLLRYLVTGLAAFGGTLLAVRIMRGMASNNGYGLFGFYCWGMALFTFILNILV